MAATGVTYDGVPSAQGGDIFQDVKFWVARRVPNRPAILDHITSNGGVIKPLEKDADMLIADCARKDVPPDSYSWKFITESIANGIAQLKDRYLIGARQSLSGPARLTKPTRTSFTQADDVFLAKWVFAHSERRTGNAIYLELERENPRHTWQSWRNRYIKFLPKEEDGLREKANEKPPPGDSESTYATRANTEPSGRVREHEVTSRQHSTPAPASPEGSPSSPVPAVTTAPETPPPLGQERVKCRKQSPEPATPGAFQEYDGPYPEAAEFYSILHLFWEARDVEHDDEHRIGGRIVGLWDISAAICKQGLPHVLIDDVEWSLVAKELGYDPTLEPEVPYELRQCFEAAELEIFFRDMEGLNVESDQTVQSASPRQSIEEHGGDSRSSPSAETVGRKRSLDPGPSSTGNSAKRRRKLSRDDEIPSTPDAKSGLSGRRPIPQAHSPSVRRNIMAAVEEARTAGVSRRVPPRASAGHADERTTLTEGCEALESRASPPVDLGVSQSPGEVTPSQHLRSAAFNASASPLHLASARASSVALQTNARASRRSLPASFGLPTNRASPRPADESAGPRRQFQSGPAVEGQDPPRGGPNDDRIAEQVEMYESLGYPNHIVVEALKRTSMTPGKFAILVMKSLKDGRGVPDHHQGVWTDRDDQGLRMVDRVNAMEGFAEAGESRKAKRTLERLTRKHGLERIELRRRFLKAEMQLRAGTTDEE